MKLHYSLCLFISATLAMTTYSHAKNDSKSQNSGSSSSSSNSASSSHNSGNDKSHDDLSKDESSNHGHKRNHSNNSNRGSSNSNNEHGKKHDDHGKSGYGKRNWGQSVYHKLSMKNEYHREKQKFYFWYLKHMRKMLSQYYRLSIETKPDGTGTEIQDTLKAGDRLTAYSILRNKKGKFIKNIKAIWGVNADNAVIVNSELGNLRYGKFIEIEGRKIGLAGLFARHKNFGEAISDLIIVPGNPIAVRIENFNGNQISELVATPDQTVELFPNLYDRFNNFAGTADQAVFEISGTYTGSIQQNISNIYEFNAINVGSGTLSVSANGLIDSIESVIVNPGSLHHISIETNLCNGEVFSVSQFSINDKVDIYSCLRDRKDNFIAFGASGLWEVIGDNSSSGFFVSIPNGVNFTARSSCVNCAISYIDNGISGITNNFSIVNPAPQPAAVSLAIVTDPVANTCIAVNAQVVDQNDMLIVVNSPVSIDLTASRGAFYFDPSCSSSINAVTVMTNNSFQRVYYSTSEAGFVDMTASSISSNLASGTITVNIEAPFVIDPLARTLSAGFNQSCAIFAGQMRCTNNIDNNFMPILNEDGSVFSPNLLSKKIGFDHNCAIKGQNVFCWGANTFGQLGTGDNISSQFPKNSTNVPSNASFQINEVEAGGMFTCIRENNIPKCWGSNSSAQLGFDPTILQSRNFVELIPTIGTLPVTQITVGFNYTCFLFSSSMFCFGGNEFGQLARPPFTFSPNLQQVLGIPPLKRIASNEYQSCGVTNSDQVMCWGKGAIVSTTPTSIFDISGAQIGGISSIAVGGNHVCLLSTNGFVYCMGANDHGQLGLGDVQNRPFAERVNISKVVELVAGSDHTCAKRVDGQIFCWGANNNGQLGTGDGVERHTPSLALGF